VSSYIFRDSSQVVAGQGDKILFLSHFLRIPTFEISENAAPNLLRRKEFGKTNAVCRDEVRPNRPACFR
jgi:hypothetical protein